MSASRAWAWLFGPAMSASIAPCRPHSARSHRDLLKHCRLVGIPKAVEFNPQNLRNRVVVRPPRPSTCIGRYPASIII